MWEAEWQRPQAVMWEAYGQEVEVALFVRSLVEAELPSATTSLRTLVRQQMEALGISIPGLLRNRWRISAAEVDGDDSSGQPEGFAHDDPRSRLTVVAGKES